MIKSNTPLSMIEAVEYVKKAGDKEIDLPGFMKKFMKSHLKETKELKKKIEALDFMKVKTEHIAKIIDLMPENAEDLNKIFTDIGLDENETKSVLDTIKEFK